MIALRLLYYTPRCDLDEYLACVEVHAAFIWTSIRISSTPPFTSLLIVPVCPTESALSVAYS